MTFVVTGMDEICHSFFVLLELNAELLNYDNKRKCDNQLKYDIRCKCDNILLCKRNNIHAFATLNHETRSKCAFL